MDSPQQDDLMSGGRDMKQLKIIMAKLVNRSGELQKINQESSKTKVEIKRTTNELNNLVDELDKAFIVFEAFQATPREGKTTTNKIVARSELADKSTQTDANSSDIAIQTDQPERGVIEIQLRQKVENVMEERRGLQDISRILEEEWPEEIYNNTRIASLTPVNLNSEGDYAVVTDPAEVRIDFLTLTLAQPDANGTCVYDALNIVGGAATIPTICGENSGQHIYLYFYENEDITISITTSSSLDFQRYWNIQVAQLGCACPSLAPTGCLMYYTDVSGIVNSFNYGATANGALLATNGLPGTRQLINQNYGVCIDMQPGFCSITWDQTSNPYSFTVMGDTIGLSVDPGLPTDSMNGVNCTTDFIVIPNAIGLDSDRFCGSALPTVTYSTRHGIQIAIITAEECFRAWYSDYAILEVFVVLNVAGVAMEGQKKTLSMAYIEFDKHVGTRTLSLDLGIARTTVRNILKDYR
ncbi:intraflagellar transport protein 122 family protein-related [Holotrichia oblita]|uniref:Intraflagellar transport protein 122 family protein-related n=1 Tax=Holotrichia oblita TaxID=644536 RepID=A0ACB9TVK7_HOLOL|nr:intraflagellar transport protein 122 family protein-related [Holotrichia oblita]